MKTRSILFSVIAAFALLFMTSAWAGYTNYVPRWVTFHPQTSNLGSSGYVTVLLAPAGDYSKIFYFCSVGATDTTYCDTNYLYTSDQLLALYNALQNAAATGLHVAYTNDMILPRGKVLLIGY
ncbi:MAG TPA: hypothetical protein VHL14_12100 [Steroidobacteraceae bacterium]|jgi:hypothetical protein|nr:hypothetical protein [Steroidobacteraceae bacterium]